MLPIISAMLAFGVDGGALLAGTTIIDWNPWLTALLVEFPPPAFGSPVEFPPPAAEQSLLVPPKEAVTSDGEAKVFTRSSVDDIASRLRLITSQHVL